MYSLPVSSQMRTPLPCETTTGPTSRCDFKSVYGCSTLATSRAAAEFAPKGGGGAMRNAPVISSFDPIAFTSLRPLRLPWPFRERDATVYETGGHDHAGRSTNSGAAGPAGEIAGAAHAFGRRREAANGVARYSGTAQTRGIIRCQSRHARARWVAAFADLHAERRGAVSADGILPWQ